MYTYCTVCILILSCTYIAWHVQHVTIFSNVNKSTRRTNNNHYTLHCTALHCTALHCTALHCTVLHCTALHCTALHCKALHCTTLHCTALQYTGLHATSREEGLDAILDTLWGLPLVFVFMINRIYIKDINIELICIYISFFYSF